MVTTQCGCELCKGLAGRGNVFTDAPDAFVQRDASEGRVETFRARGAAARSRPQAASYVRRGESPADPLSRLQSLVHIAEWPRTEWPRTTVSGAIATGSHAARAGFLRDLS